MKFGVVVFPGSNCEHDCHYVIERVIRRPVDWIWHQETDLHEYDAIILPGGFSYGDYLRAGAIARFSPVMQAVERFAADGGVVLGICNGFQILLEAGLLPGAMLRNRSLRFICKEVTLRVENINTPFTLQYLENQVIRMPIAHADGNYTVDRGTLDRMEKNGQIIFRYCTPNGEIADSANPNGSVENIAGICNEEGNILGMMPHPERAAETILGGCDGYALFESMVKFLSVRTGNSVPR